MFAVQNAAQEGVMIQEQQVEYSVSVLQAGVPIESARQKLILEGYEASENRLQVGEAHQEERCQYFMEPGSVGNFLLFHVISQHKLQRVA